MLSRLRESLALVLIALLPMHAMLVTVITHLLRGQNHPPLASIAMWKEALLGVVIVIAILEIVRNFWGKRKVESEKWKALGLDAIDLCILIGILFAFVQFFIVHLPSSIHAFAFGFKYDFLPLCAFFVLRRVPWSRNFSVAAARTIVMVATIAVLFGIVTLYLPYGFFTALGYSDLHSLYLPHSSIAAFQFLEDSQIRRMQSFMSGPNQFGLWLLIALAANIQLLSKALRERRTMDVALYLTSAILVLGALYFTYSRSSWIGALVMVAVASIALFRHTTLTVLQRRFALTSLCVLAGLFVIASFSLSPQVLQRTQSLKGHIEKPLAAIQMIRTHPFGLGLGSAGPASNRTSDTCAFFGPGADVSWAKSRTDICVYVDGVQKLPVDKSCQCPLLTENWYLQWGVEMGWLGLVLSVMLVVFVLRKWSVQSPELLPATQYPLLAFVGISIAALFLHAWEDAAVTYTVWLLLSACGIFVRPARIDPP